MSRAIRSSNPARRAGNDRWARAWLVASRDRRATSASDFGVLADERVAGGDRFDLGVGEHDFGVEVLDGADGVGGVDGAVIWAMNRALRSTVPHMYGSKLPVVT